MEGHGGTQKAERKSEADIIVTGALMLLPLVDLSVNEKARPQLILVSHRREMLLCILNAPCFQQRYNHFLHLLDSVRLRKVLM